MIVHVKLFALAAELTGADTLELELPARTTIAELRARLAAEHPSLGPLVAAAMFAIDAQYATDGAEIPANAQVACIPPVSGG